MVAAARATEVDSAIEAVDFETEPAPKLASTRFKRLAPHGALRRVLEATRL